MKGYWNLSVLSRDCFAGQSTPEAIPHLYPLTDAVLFTLALVLVTGHYGFVGGHQWP